MGGDATKVYRPGDVFQIQPTHGREGWIGALVLTEEIHRWGILGFIPQPKTHDVQARVYIRLKWEEIAHIGHGFLPEG